jgi:hypothetical protein
VQLTFTEVELAAAAKAYDPAKHEAPIVVGHPKDTAPAYGWIKSLSFAESQLRAEPHQVLEDFAELVKQGAFKKVSASFYTPEAKSNPVPGVYYLRHVGFLGAQPPALKGLSPISFNEAEEGVVEFTDWHGMQIAGIFRRIKNWIIDSAGQEKADTIMPEYELENLTVSAAKKDDVPAYAEPPQGDPAMDAKQQQELAAREAALKADKEKLERERAEFTEEQKRLAGEKSAAARAKLRREAGELVDGLVKEGKVLPAQRDGMVAFMASQSAEGAIEFGEGDKAVKKPAAEWLRDYLKAQPKVIDFAERGKGDGAETVDNDDAADIAKRIVEYQESELKAGRTVTTTDAAMHVTKQAAQ